MKDNYTVKASSTSVEAGIDGYAPVVVSQDFETKYEAIKWAWLVLKHRNDTLNLKFDLSKVEHVDISSNMDDDDWYFAAHADDDDLVFIKLLAAENPQAPALED